MSFMVKEFFLASPLLVYPLIALALFMGVFVMVTVATMMKRSESYAQVADLPLRDQPPHEEAKS